MRLVGSSLGLARKWVQNRTLRATAIFALSGLAFALGNLLLARTMPTGEFGRAALEIALLNLFAVIGPLGLDQVLLRHGPDPSGKMFWRALAANVVVAGLVAAAALRLYDLPPRETSLVAIAIAATGTGVVASAGMRAQGWDAMPLAMVMGTNALLLLAGLHAVLAGETTVLLILAIVAAGNVLMAALAWAIFMSRGRLLRTVRAPIRWGEAISLLGLVAVGALAIQLERFIIPKTLGAEALAVFSVLSSVATFPFRLVTSSAGFALAPQLRGARDLAERKTFVLRELRTILMLLFIATAVILTCAPPVTRWLTGDRYDLGFLLVLSACLSGYVKVIQSLIRAVVIGCGSHRATLMLNAIGWVAICTSASAGIFASRWGLEGLIVGMALGSFIGNIPAAVIAVRSMRNLS